MSSPNSGGGGGTDIASLHLGVTTDAAKAEAELNSFGTATIVQTRRINDMSAAVQKNNEWLEQSAKKHQNRIQQLTAEWEKEQKAAADIARAERDAARAKEELTLAGQRFIDQLTVMNAQAGKTTAELQRMKAAELGVAEAAAPLIAALELQTKEMTKLEYAAFRTMEAHEALYLKTTAAAEYAAFRQMEANESVYLKGVAARTADEAALVKHVEEEIAIGNRKTAAAEYAALKEMEVAEALYLKRTAAAEYAAFREMEANESVFLKRQAQMKADEVALTAHIEKEIAIGKAKLEAAEYAALKEMEAAEQLYLKRTAAAEYAALKEMEANEAVFLKKQAQRKADELAAEEHQRKELARIAAATSAAEYAAFRQMEAAEQIYLRKTQQREKDLAAAEKAAQMDIRYAEMSTKQKIAELEKLAAYKGNTGIGGDTFNSLFSKAAQADLANYTKHVNDLKAAQEALKATHSSAHAPATSVADALSKISFQSSRARSEIIVLLHEMVQGRFSRMPASMMVLAEYTNMASLAFTGFGVAALAMLVTLGTVAWEMAKGASELYKFNNVMQLTGGFSGQTRDSLHEMALELKGNVHGQIGTATEMLLALNATGKFTADTLQAIGGAALNFQRLSGQSTEQVVGMFQQLGAVHGKVFNEMQNKIAEWAAKQNETYHFLNAQSYERIRLLALEGRNQEAMIEIADRMSESLQKQDKNVGYLMASYLGFKQIIQEIGHAMKEWGKEDSTGQLLDAAKQQLKALEQASEGFAAGMANPKTKNIYEGRFMAVAAQYAKQAGVVAQLQKKFDDEQLAAQKKSEDKQIEQQGVFGQREVDYIETHARSRNQIGETYIQRYLQGVTMANRDIIHQWEKTHNIDAANNQAAVEAAIASGELKIINAERVEKTVADIRAKYNRGGGGNTNKDDPRWIELQTQLSKFEDEGDKAKRAIDAQVAEEKDAFRDGESSVAEHYNKLRAIEAQELSAAQAVYDKKVAALKGFSAKTEVERAKVAKQMQDIRAALDKAIDSNGAAGENLDRDEVGANKKALKTTVGNITTDGARELEELNKKIEAQKKYNEEIGKTAAQRQLVAIALADEADQQRKRDALYLEALLDTEKAKPEDEQNKAAIAAYGARLAALQKLIAAQADINRLKDIGAKLDAEQADFKKADDLAKSWKEAGNDIAKALEQAFGKGGKAAGELFKVFSRGTAEQLQLDNKLRKSKKENEGLQDEEARNAKAQNEYNQASARNRMNEYGNMAGAAAGFFDEQSKGYKALMVMSQVFHAAELALTIAELVPKGISAILTQGQGDSYSAFARMAAMAAIVAGLGVAISGKFSDVNVAKDRQEAQGTGTVFGNVDAKSESISKSLELIEDNTYQNLVIGSGMLQALRAIQAGIGGLSGILLNNGVTGDMPANTYGGMSSLGSLIGSPLKSMPGGEWLGKQYASLTNSIFGGKTTNLDTGLTANKTSVGNIVNGGLVMSQYLDTKKDGGIFHSDKYKTQLTALDKDVNDQFALIFKGLSTTINAAGEALGIGGAAFNERLKSIIIDFGKISFKDLSAEEIQKEIEAVVSKLGDDMASLMVAGLNDYAKLGEGQLETLVRIAAEYQTIDTVFQSFNKTFGQIGLSSVAARSRLIELSGGLEEFVSQASTFLDTFYTDKEKAKFLKGQLDPTFAKYGLTTSQPNSEEMFRKFIEGLDTTTQYGAEAYAALMGLVPAFKEILDVTKAIAEERQSIQDEIDELVMTPAQLIAKQREELDESNRSLFDYLQLLKKQKEAQDTNKESLSQTIEKLKTFAQSMREMRDGLLLSDLTTLTPEQQYLEALRQFDNTVAKAKTGDEEAQSQISAAANAFLQASRVVNASDPKYSSDFAKVLRITEEMEQWATAKASVEQLSLDALNAQVAGITNLNNTLNDVLWAIRDPRPAAAMPSLSGNPTTASEKAMMAAELKALREEVSGMRAEANTNTANVITSNAKVTAGAAQTTVSGIMSSAANSSYKNNVLSMAME